MSSAPPSGSGHVDDEFHAPTSDDVEWTETCWFTFAVAERNMSIQFYPYFRPNLGVAAGAVMVWDGLDQEPSTCRYAKNFWHLPMPDGPLTDMTLANGITYRCDEPLRRYHVGYADPDGGDLRIDLDVTCITEPLVLHTHFDQATTAVGSIHIDGETLEIECVGFRDRSWGVRSQFGPYVMGPASHASYSWATAADGNGFFSMCGDFGYGDVNVHGFLRLDGVTAMISSGTHAVLDRTSAAHPSTVVVAGVDQLGRSFSATGTANNGLGWSINPNLYTINTLMTWTIDTAAPAPIVAVGEDHDNWSAASIRAFHRSRRTN